MLYGYDSSEAVCGELMEENRRLREENEQIKQTIREIIERLREECGDGTDKDA